MTKPGEKGHYSHGWKADLLKRIDECHKAINNRSPKPLKRLKASLAALELPRLLSQLTGADKRGLSRGKAI